MRRLGTGAQGHGKTGKALLVLSVVLCPCAPVPLLSQCPDGTPPPCAGPRLPPLNPDRIAILPFRVSGADPALAYLREGMVDLLAAEFTGEGGPAAAEAGTAIRAWNRMRAGDPDDRASALRVARSLGAGQVLLGTVVGTPRHLYVSATIVGVPRGEVRVAQVRVEGSADSLTVLLRDLLARLVTGRGGVWRLSANDPGTTSNEALHAYMAGRAAYRSGDYAQAGAAFRRALALDSSFVLAAYNMLLVGQWAAGAVRDIATMRRVAFEGRARLGALDQALLATFVGPRYPEFPTKADWLAAARRAVELEPQSPEAQFRLGDVLFHFGEALGISEAPRLSAAAFDASVALDTTADPLMHLVELALADGDPARARRFGALLERMAPSQDLLWRRWLAAAAVGDSTAARAAWSDPLARTAGFNAFSASLALRTGVPAAAAHALARAHALATTDAERRDVDRAEFSVLLNTGRRAAARQLSARLPGQNWTLLLGTELTDSAAVTSAARAFLETRPAPRPDSVASDACPASLRLAESGDTASVGTLLGVPADNGELPGLCALLARAIGSAATGGSLAALASVDSLLRLVPVGWTSWLQFRLAQAWARRGRYQEAARAALPARDAQPLFLAASLRDAARFAALAGDTATALRAARRYLRLRTDPDSETVAERDGVRALLARLEHR